MSAHAPSAWLLVMKSDAERSWAANRGYDDSVGLYYSYDSNVANWRRLQAGDLVVVRSDDYVAGWAYVESLDVTEKLTQGDPSLPEMQGDSMEIPPNDAPERKV